MSPQLPQLPFSAAGVLADAGMQLSENANIKQRRAATLEVLRRWVATHQLRQLPVAPRILFSAGLELMQHGHLTQEMLLELGGAVPDKPSSDILIQAACREKLQIPSSNIGLANSDASLAQREYRASFEDVPHKSNGASHFHREFECMELLGSGAFGEVWHCRRRSDGKEFAVKAVRYRASGIGSDRLEGRVLREAETWSGMNHPNIVQYHGAWVEVDWDPAKEPDRVLPKTEHDWLCDADESEESSNDSSEESACGVVFKDSVGGPTHALSAVSTADATEPVVADEDSCSWCKSKSGDTLEYRATLYIKMELCSTETLQSWLNRRNKLVASGNALQEEIHQWNCAAVKIFHQSAQALAHLHAGFCAHRDVKPSNIIFARDGSVRLGDFGLAKTVGGTPVMPEAKLMLSGAHILPVLTNSSQSCTRGVGTPSYASPEQMAGEPYGVETDIYALGTVLAELLCPIKTQMERARLLENLHSGRKLPDDVTELFPTAAKLAVAMTSKEPSARPNARELVEAVPAILLEVHKCTAFK